MFTINEDGSIHVTRGDIVFFTVTAEKDGSPYVFQAGDVVRFKVMQKKACDKVAFQKDFPIEEETETVDIYLTTAETKIGKVISKPVDYWYEVELNPLTNPQTIIGYDDDGAKIFKLFPEGDDIDDYEINEEDIPLIDDRLDITSTRPVENQAVTREIVKFNSQIKGLLTLSDRVDNFLNSSTEDGEVLDIRVDFRGRMHNTAGESVRKQIEQVLSAANLKEGIQIYPTSIDQYGIRISGMSLKPNTKYRLEYIDIYETEIVINAVRYTVPSEPIEPTANVVDGGYEFTTGDEVCKNIYIDLYGASWDGELATAEALMDGIFLFNVEEKEKIKQLIEDVENLKINGLTDYSTAIKNIQRAFDEHDENAGIHITSGEKEQIKKNTQLIADLMYKTIEITSFTNNVKTAEVGSVVNSVILSWALNKDAVSLTIDGVDYTDNSNTSLALTDLNLSANKTWTMKVTDERGATATATTSLSFLNGAYYGIGAVPDAYDSEFILGLASKVITNTKARTINVDADTDEYIFYCIPARLGTCSFNVGGFDGGFELVATLDFTNASGYTESYYVYKSTNASLGSTTVKIS